MTIAVLCGLDNERWELRERWNDFRGVLDAIHRWR